MEPMRLSSLGIVAFVALSGCTSSNDASVTVENEQSVAIDQLYVDDVGDESFSDNLLGGEPLEPNSTITISVSCGNYDVSIHNLDATHCVITDLSLCFTDVDWIIDDSTCTFADRKTGKTLSAPIVADTARD